MLELTQIVDRFAEGIPRVDRSTTVRNSNPRTGDSYLTSAVSLGERQLVAEIADWWADSYPAELPRHSSVHLEYPYPDILRANCDLVIAGNRDDGRFDWAVEVKKIRLVGDNGKNNDYVLQKLLSPWLKDRSLQHDALRLRKASFAARKAVVLVGFDFKIGAIDEAELISDRLKIDRSRVDHLRRTLRRVDPASLEYVLDPVVDIADEALALAGVVKAKAHRSRFSGLMRHPCGLAGLVSGWEVSEENI